MAESEQLPEKLSEAQRTELIEAFEVSGFAVFRQGVDRLAFEALTKYIAEHHIPTFTSVDRGEGTVSITKRPFGALELF